MNTDLLENFFFLLQRALNHQLNQTKTEKKNKVDPYSEEDIVNAIDREDNPISWLCHV